MTQKKKGFTLIELMVVMAIIAVLAVLMIGAIQLARSTATETTHRSNGKTLQTAAEAYFAKNKVYPNSAGTITFDAAATLLGVTINDSCTSNVTAKDGGTFASTTDGYTITPYNSTCGAALGATDIITVP